MIRKVTIKHFKRFEDLTVDLPDSLVLAGPNNSGKTTLLQAIALWKFGLEKWLAQRQGKSLGTKKDGSAYHPARIYGSADAGGEFDVD